jgi:hypothetical protein
MIIDFYFDHYIAVPVINVKVYSDYTELSVKDINGLCQHYRVDLGSDRLEPQVIQVEFSTDDPTIINNPLVVSKIVLDDFYSLSKFVYTGKSIFDNWFCEYAGQNNINLDQNINDNNCLNHTGKLIYKFNWPFFRNLWQ